jgi:hypothetical protein
MDTNEKFHMPVLVDEEQEPDTVISDGVSILIVTAIILLIAGCVYFITL